jgi:hypothetical protein
VSFVGRKVSGRTRQRDAVGIEFECAIDVDGQLRMKSQRISAPIEQTLGRSALQYIRQRLSLLSESQGDGVQAMTFASRCGAIWKHMTQMAAAARTDFLKPNHSIARITHATDMGFIIGFEETRPAGPGIKLGAGPEERQAAKAAGVNTVLMIVEEYAAEGSLGAVLEQHAPLVLVKTGADLRTLCRCWRLQIELAHRNSSGSRDQARRGNGY